MEMEEMEMEDGHAHTHTQRKREMQFEGRNRIYREAARVLQLFTRETLATLAAFEASARELERRKAAETAIAAKSQVAVETSRRLFWETYDKKKRFAGGCDDLAELEDELRDFEACKARHFEEEALLGIRRSNNRSVRETLEYFALENLFAFAEEASLESVAAVAEELHRQAEGIDAECEENARAISDFAGVYDVVLAYYTKKRDDAFVEVRLSAAEVAPSEEALLQQQIEEVRTIKGMHARGVLEREKAAAVYYEAKSAFDRNCEERGAFAMLLELDARARERESDGAKNIACNDALLEEAYVDIF